ncbi:hypothetical protein OG749_01870 [Streptomyces nojiriensis]
MIDLHNVTSMDVTGLLVLLDSHRQGECLGLRVLVVGWQSQPQELMAQVAGMPGPSSSTGERYAGRLPPPDRGTRAASPSPRSEQPHWHGTALRVTVAGVPAARRHSRARGVTPCRNATRSCAACTTLAWPPGSAAP